MGNGNNSGSMIAIMGIGGVAVCCLSSSAAAGLAWYLGMFDPPTDEPTPSPDGGGGAATGKWMCPTGTVWGWGANLGKCCKDGKCPTGPKFVPGTGTPAPAAPAAPAATWVCPAGYGWGWGASAGKCCIGNAKCVVPVKAGSPAAKAPAPAGPAAAPAQCACGTDIRVHDDKSCWAHNGSEDWKAWKRCYGCNVGTHACA